MFYTNCNITHIEMVPSRILSPGPITRACERWATCTDRSLWELFNCRPIQRQLVPSSRGLSKVDLLEPGCEQVIDPGKLVAEPKGCQGSIKPRLSGHRADKFLFGELIERKINFVEFPDRLNMLRLKIQCSARIHLIGRSIGRSSPPHPGCK